MKRIRKSVLAGLVAASLLSMGSSPVWAQAQPSPSASTQADVEALKALNSAAAATALGTQPVAADQLALGDRFVKAMNLRAGLDQTFAAMLEPAKAQILQSLTNQPAATKAKFVAAVDEAMASTRNEIVDKLIQGMTRYYAVRLTTTQLTEALAFYEAPLGQKSVRDPQGLTEAEKQEMGLYVMAHPTIIEVLGSAMGSMEVSQGLTAREMPGMTARFKTRLCAALKTRGLSSGGCPKGA